MRLDWCVTQSASCHYSFWIVGSNRCVRGSHIECSFRLAIRLWLVNRNWCICLCVCVFGGWMIGLGYRNGYDGNQTKLRYLCWNGGASGWMSQRKWFVGGNFSGHLLFACEHRRFSVLPDPRFVVVCRTFNVVCKIIACWPLRIAKQL